MRFLLHGGRQHADLGEEVAKLRLDRGRRPRRLGRLTRAGPPGAQRRLRPAGLPGVRARIFAAARRPARVLGAVGTALRERSQLRRAAGRQPDGGRHPAGHGRHGGDGDGPAGLPRRRALRAPLAEAVAGLAAAAVPPVPAVAGAAACVLDAGAGPGYYLAAVLDRIRGRPGGTDAAGLAMDISAGRSAGPRGPARHRRGRVGHLAPVPGPRRRGVAGPQRLRAAQRAGIPPRAARRRRPDRGHARAASPGRAGRRGGLLAVDARKDERVGAALGAYFALADARDLTVPLRLTRPEAATLVVMGPAARHTDPGAVRERLAGLPEPIKVTAAFRIARYRPA